MFTYHLFLVGESELVVDIINRVAAEGKFLQTGSYVPTGDWESVLGKGIDKQSGRLLIVVKAYDVMVGFGRLFPAGQRERNMGNVGIVLLPQYRYKGVGTRLLGLIVDVAPAYGYGFLTADILADNFISLRLFQSRGFMEYSRRRLNLPHRSAVVDEVRMQLLLPKGVRETNVQLSNNFKAG